ncbi:MAG: flagellar biosynthesis protein FlhA [Anaerolineae bacterium]|nr:flagellar biosynthesis protein FlhA [Anaerolineae bacterium]MDW8099689.1 flagellar biosynthesis protein FlhA [Anaerolineae bacterium]
MTANPGTGTLYLRNLNRVLRQSDIVLAVAVVGIMTMMVIPIPPILLDLLLTLNFSISIAILLITMYVREPLQFSVFPSLLLIVTLFRLGLNISSSRSILLHAYAGQVIQAFGQFVVGGNYIVGIVIFLLLMIIQFVVITNGAGRVAEVAARFTLDAMPGKQMSIDADLNAGLINEEQARQRRHLIELEADFYGAMDGASKFVKGDAIAAVAIILVNILGGFAIGILQMGMTLPEALRTYTLLTVGDGLVAQIPALLVSTATGIIVTRAAATENMGQEILQQTITYPRALMIVAGMLVLFGLVPGLPKVPFFVLGALVGGASYLMSHMEMARRIEKPEETRPTPMEEADDVSALLRVDPLELELGYGLISLVDEAQEGSLLPRISAVRRQIALELGFVLPKVRIRDNLTLPPNTYTIKLRSEEVGRGEVLVNHFLALSPGPEVDLNTLGEEVKGLPTKEPVFGMPALWIDAKAKERAEILGYTVVDPSSVITTHLMEVAKAHAAELLGRQEVQKLIEKLRPDYPAVVDEVLSDRVGIGLVQKVLQNLLRERISIRDLLSILEAIMSRVSETRDPDLLSEYARLALSRAITNQLRGPDGALHVLTLGPGLESTLIAALQPTDWGMAIALSPDRAQTLLREVRAQVERMITRGYQPTLLCSSRLRLPLRRFLQRSLPTLAILAYNEVASGVEIYTEGMIELEEAEDAS